MSDAEDTLDALFGDSSPLPSLDEAIEKLASDIDPGSQTSGFAQMWGELVKTACQDGWRAAKRQAELVDFPNQDDPYRAGQMKAASFALDQDSPELEGVYRFVRGVYDQADSDRSARMMAKEASKQTADDQPTREKVGQWAAATLVSDYNVPLEKVAYQAPVLLQKLADGQLEETSI